MPEPTDQTVTVRKASPIHQGDAVDGRIIAITDPLPTFDDVSVSDIHSFFDEQARMILGALNAALPGGTLDSLFAQAAYDRASILRVARQLPPPADDDVVDAEVIGFEEQVVALEAQRAAVLALHKPNEYGLHCEHCLDSHEELVDWPCPTAEALGVTS